MADQFDAEAAVNNYLNSTPLNTGATLRNNLNTAAGSNPDFEAEIQRLAKETGVPLESARAYPDDVKRRAEVEAIDPDDLVKNYPATASVLADGDKARVVRDDVPNLQELEARIKKYGELKAPPERGYWSEVGGELINRGPIGAGIAMLKPFTDPFRRGFRKSQRRFSIGLNEMGAFNGLRAQREEVRRRAGMAPEGLSEFAQLLENQQRYADQIPVPPSVQAGMREISGAQTFGEAVEAIAMNPRAAMEMLLESVGGSVPGMAVTYVGGLTGPIGQVAGAGAGSFALEYAGTIEEVMTESGVDPTDSYAIARALENPELMAKARDKAVKRGVPITIASMLTAGLAGRLLAGAKGTVGSVASRAGGELALQAGGGAAGEALAQAATGEFKPSDIILEALGEMPTALVEVPGNYRDAMTRAKAAEVETQLVSELTELANASKVLKRDPETFEQLLDQSAAGGPVQDVYVSAQVLNQEGVAQALAQLSPTAAQQIQTAMMTGNDVRIPLGEYMSKVAPSDLSQSLLDHVKFDPAGFSRAEATEFMQNQQTELQTEMEKVLADVQADTTFKTSTEAVQAQIEEQFKAAGAFTDSASRAYATLASRYFAVKAARLGVTPEQLFARKGFRIAREGMQATGAELAQGMSEDQYIAAINPTGKRLQESDRPTIYAADIEGAMPVTAKKVKGAFKTKDGRRVDVYRDDDSGSVWAKVDGVEVGFMSPLSDSETDLSVAAEIQRQGVGTILSTEFRRANPMAQSGGLTEAGERTARAVFRRLQSEGVFNQSQPFDGPEQAATPLDPDTTEIEVDGVMRPAQNSNGQPIHWSAEGVRNFWRWFGDSKVVDDQGRPLVVYHGREGDFTEFNTSGGTGKTFGTGAFFTESAAVANTYLGGAESNITPVYLRLTAPVVIDAKGANWSKLGKSVKINTPAVEVSDQENEDLFAELTGAPAKANATKKVKAKSTTLGRMFPEEFQYGDETFSTDDLVRWARKQGHESVIFRSVKDPGPSGRFASEDGAAPHDSFVAFDPTQIKSATGNRGTFDRADANILNQSAFHGSPAAFTPESDAPLGRLRWKYINTGEGAQSFGYGHYLAQQEAVARTRYRDRLVKQKLEVLNIARPGGSPVTITSKDEPAWRIGDRLVHEKMGGEEKSLASAVADINRLGGYQQARDMYKKYNMGEAQLVALDAVTVEAPSPDGKQRVLRPDIEEVRPESSAGALYGNFIPDAQWGRMMIWDAPMSAQPEVVQKAFERLGVKGGAWATTPAEDAYRFAASIIDGVDFTGEVGALVLQADKEIAARRGFDPDSKEWADYRAENFNAEEVVSVILHGLGVPGHRFLDGQTRADGWDSPDAKFNVVLYSDDLGRAAWKATGKAGEVPTKWVTANGRGVIEKVGSDLFVVKVDGGEIDRAGTIEGATRIAEKALEGQFYQNRNGVRGSYRPSTRTITLTPNADLSTFLHELGHYFLEMEFELMLEMQQEVAMFGADPNNPGQREAVNDWNALLAWFADPKELGTSDKHVRAWREVEANVRGLEDQAKKDPARYGEAARVAREAYEWAQARGGEGYLAEIAGNFGAEVPSEYRLTLLTPYHERFARGFEVYLMEGKAPSVELEPLFRQFRAWLLSVYRQMMDAIRTLRKAGNTERGAGSVGEQALNVELSDEVRTVFDRMLATTEEIKLAEKSRSMMPLITEPGQLGVTAEELRALQELGTEATQAAIEDLQARGVRDVQYMERAKSRAFKELKKRADALRKEVEIEARREVLQEPIYRAWQFLTGKLSSEDRANMKPVGELKAGRKFDPTLDSLFAAIAKLGGLKRSEIESQWGWDKKEASPMPAFGAYLLRREGGLEIDQMAQALAEHGYLQLDKNGKADTRELEEKFELEYRGKLQYSTQVDTRIFQGEQRSGEGATLENMGAGRLDEGELRVMGVGDDVIKALSDRKMLARDGLHPDVVSEMFYDENGAPLFTSGDQLVRELAVVTPLKDEIEARTDAMMLERYGELSSDEAIDKAAARAIHNDVRARFIAAQLNLTERALGSRKTLREAAKQMAEAMISRLRIRDVRPSQYANAEARAGKNAEKAMRAGDIELSAAEQRNQLVNMYAAKAAYNAQDEVESGLQYLKRFETPGKIPADHYERILALLDKFELRKSVTNKALDSRASFATWVKAQLQIGEIPPNFEALLSPQARRDLAADLQSRNDDGELIYADEDAQAERIAFYLDASPVRNYKDVTIEEFRGLIATIKQIEHVGKRMQTVLTDRKNRQFAEVIDGIKANAVEVANRAERSATDVRSSNTASGRLAEMLRGHFFSHVKASALIEVIDGRQGGPLWETLMSSANEATDAEVLEVAQAHDQIKALLRELQKSGDITDRAKFFPTIDRSLNRQARIAMALNMGNESNMQRLLGGEGWTMEQIKPVIDTLTAADWQFVQSVWDMFEQNKPRWVEVYRKINGVTPEMVEPRALTVQTADGQTLNLRGGYAPVIYDPRGSGRAQTFADSKGAELQVKAARMASTVGNSFTKARVDEVTGRPLLLSLDAIINGMQDTIHYTHWQPWIIDANRIVKALDPTLRQYYGAEAVKVLRDWVSDTAAGVQAPRDTAERTIAWLARNVSFTALAMNVLNAAQQVTGIASSVVTLGTGGSAGSGYVWYARGVSQVMKEPRVAYREAIEKSPFMRKRATTMLRDLNEVANVVQDEGRINEFSTKYGYILTQVMQVTVDLPTWWAAYHKAGATQGGFTVNPDGSIDDSRAIALADQAVVDSQGGGAKKDLARYERATGAMRLLSGFMSYMNAMFNQNYRVARSNRSVARKVHDFLLINTIPVVGMVLLKAMLVPGGDDEPEDLAKKIATEQVGFLFGQMIGLREISQIGGAVGGEPFAGQYGGPVGLRAASDALRLAKQIGQGEADESLLKATISFAGDVFRLPSVQINRTITGYNALESGETDDPTALLFGYQKQ